MSGQDEIRFDDILLDRLVDGELSESEYRQALGVMESHPDGWRRCALAFLEAQAWGREFRLVRTETPVASAKSVPSRRGWSWWYAGAMVVACAASFLLAFEVAIQLQNRPRSLPSFKDLAAHAATSSLDGNAAADPGIQFASNSDSPDMSPIDRYRLVVDGESGQPQEVEMPVFSPDDPRADLLLDEYATMPREIIRALQKNGNEVQRRRNWIPMRGSSGAPLYVPVDELQVTPVSNRSFQ